MSILYNLCIAVIKKLIFFFSPFKSLRITAKIDDDMIAYYCNEDLFLLEVRQFEEDVYDITLTELPNH